MARRGSRSRIFTETDKQALLEAIGGCREACIRAVRSAPIGGDIYKRTESLIESMDGVAEVLTGDKTHFHAKMAAPFSQAGQHNE